MAALPELDQAADPTPDPGLLDALPRATIDWTNVSSEVQRDLLDDLQLESRYDRATNTAHGHVTVVGDTGDRIPARSAQTMQIPALRTGPPAP